MSIVPRLTESCKVFAHLDCPSPRDAQRESKRASKFVSVEWKCWPLVISSSERPLWPGIKQGQACLPLKSTGEVTTKSDGLYVFVLLHRHFLVEPQKRSQGWSYPVEVQADAWRSPPGIAFKPFFPAQALMATNRALRSSRRGQVLRFLAEGNHLHRLSTPVPDPVPTDGSPGHIHPTDG